LRKPILFILLLSGAIALAQPSPRPPALRDFLEIKLPSALQFSPDSRQIVLVISENDFEESETHTNLWIMGVTDTTARPLTRYRQSARLPRWSPDGNYIAFLDDGRSAKDGESEKPKPQVWLLPATGGEAVQLTETKNGISSYDWLPESRGLVYLTEKAEQAELSLIKKKNTEQKIDGVEIDKERRLRQLWRINIESAAPAGEPIKLLDGDFGMAEVDVSPDGNYVLYRTNYTGKEDDARKFDYWVYSFADGKIRQLTSRRGEESAGRWSPDGRFIMCLAPFEPAYTYSRLDLFSVRASGGEMIAAGNDLDRSVTGCEWSADGKSAHFTLAAGVDELVYSKALPATKSRPKRVTTESGLHEHLAVSPNGMFLAMTRSDGAHPPEIYLYNLKTGSTRQLTRLNSPINKLALSTAEIIRWKSADDQEIEGLLLKPRSYQPGARVPMITIPHGGPFWRNRLALHELDEAQVYAAHGYAVFLPNFRGSDGYGHEFGIANFRDLGFGDFYDLMTGIDHVIDSGVADAERLGIVGGSYGGYMTNWAISHSDRFKAAVSRYGIFSLITDFSNSNIPSFEPDYLGDFYWNDPAAYAKHSPSTNVERIHTPVLIQHGQEDPNTFISNSLEMYTALKTLGRTVEFVTYPREEHGFREPNHQIDVVDRTVQWFDRFLKNVGYDRAAAFKVGDLVSGRSGALKIVSVARNGNYAGQQAEGEFLEIALQITSNDDSEKLTLEFPADLVLLDSAGNVIAPIGVPTQIGETRALARGSIEFSTPVDSAKAAGRAATLHASAVFDVPAQAKKLKAKVLDFPLIAIDE